MSHFQNFVLQKSEADRLFVTPCLCPEAAVPLVPKPKRRPDFGGLAPSTLQGPTETSVSLSEDMMPLTFHSGVSWPLLPGNIW